MAEHAVVARADVAVTRGGEAALDILHETVADLAQQCADIGSYGNVHKYFGILMIR
jgi:hypothetical protein